MSNKWTQSLTVDKRIVPLLSRSTYEDFPKAIRELVSNAYDADATSINISINLINREIVIRDNGNGMSKNAFVNYLRIAGEQIGKQHLSPKLNRNRIGQFGIGFLAVFPFCEIMQVTTTAENSNDIIIVPIPSQKYFEQAKSKDKNVSDIPITGTIEINPTKRKEHFTEIKLLRCTNLMLKYFSPPPTPKKHQRDMSIRSWEPLKRFRWELQENLPLLFPPKSLANQLFPYPGLTPMEVYLNGKQLFRNECPGDLLEKGKKQAGNIKYSYALYTPWKSIRPQELRFIKIRLNNVGVGIRNNFDVGLTRTFPYIGYVSGEIHITEGMDDQISLNRDSFITNNDYDTFFTQIKDLIYTQLNYIEKVQTPKKKILKHLDDKSTSPVISIKKTLDESVKSYQNLGFKINVQQKSDKKSFKKNKPISVDTKSKIVTINYDYDDLNDTVVFCGKKIPVEYLSWDPDKTNFPACRLGPLKNLQINTNYPLFKLHKHGGLFKKLHILMLEALKKSTSVEQMYFEINKLLIDKFIEK